MSTRSDLIVERADGTFAYVTCHFDGYLEGVGQTLHDHYGTQALAEAVVAPGDLSCLYERCDAPPGHSYATPAEGCSIYYGRDRGEEGTEAVVGRTLLSVIWDASGDTEYHYVWLKERGWFLARDTGTTLELEPLGEALARVAVKNAPAPARPDSWVTVARS